jgi:hypothetical protein
MKVFYHVTEIQIKTHTYITSVFYFSHIAVCTVSEMTNITNYFGILNSDSNKEIKKILLRYIRHITFQSKKVKGLMCIHCLLGNTFKYMVEMK